MAVHIPHRFDNFINFQGYLYSRHVLNFHFGDNHNIILVQHVLKLLVDSALQKYHVYFGALAVWDELIYLLDSARYHVLKWRLPLPTAYQVAGLDVTVY